MAARRGAELEAQAADISARTSGRAVGIVTDLKDPNAPAGPRPRWSARSVRSTSSSRTQVGRRPPCSPRLGGAVCGGAPAQPHGFHPPGARVRPRYGRAALGQRRLSHLHGGKAAHARAAPLEHRSQRPPGLRQDSGHRGRGGQRARQYRPAGPLRHRSRGRARAGARGAGGRDLEGVLRERTAERAASGRAGEPRELAAVVAFLASNRATFLTGAAIQVDGGQIGSLL